MSSDYYEIFGVAPDADIETIKQRYRVLVRENHPDVSASEDAHARIQMILEAWSVLSQPDARKRYDLSRREAAQRSNGTASGTSAPGAKPARPGATKQNRSTSPRPKVDVNPRASNPRTRLLIMVNEAAQLYKDEGRLDEAIALCNRVLKSDPKNSEAAALLGDIYAAQGRNDLALLMYKRAMQNEPKNLLYRQKWVALQQKIAPETTAPDAANGTVEAGPAVAATPAAASARPAPSPMPPTAAPPQMPQNSPPRASGCATGILLGLGSMIACVTWLLTTL